MNADLDTLATPGEEAVPEITPDPDFETLASPATTHEVAVVADAVRVAFPAAVTEAVPTEADTPGFVALVAAATAAAAVPAAVAGRFVLAIPDETTVPVHPAVPVRKTLLVPATAPAAPAVRPPGRETLAYPEQAAVPKRYEVAFLPARPTQDVEAAPAAPVEAGFATLANEDVVPVPTAVPVARFVPEATGTTAAVHKQAAAPETALPAGCGDSSGLDTSLRGPFQGCRRADRG